jgi:hypothetical protein
MQKLNLLAININISVCALAGAQQKLVVMIQGQALSLYNGNQPKNQSFQQTRKMTLHDNMSAKLKP